MVDARRDWRSAGPLADHFPAIKRRTSRADLLRDRREEVEKVWATGASTLAMALHLGVSCTSLPKMILALRRAGAALPPRSGHHKPPADWKQRLDDLRAEEE